MAEPTDTITSIQINKTEIALGCADGFVYRYDIVAGKLRRDYVASEICSFWLADGCVLVQSQDGALRLIDANGGALLGTYSGHKVTNYRADCQMTLSKVYATCETGSVMVWDLVSQKILGKIPIREDMPLSGFDLFQDGLVAASGQKLFLRTAAINS